MNETPARKEPRISAADDLIVFVLNIFGGPGSGTLEYWMYDKGYSIEDAINILIERKESKK